MLQFIFLSFIGLSATITLMDWRRGIFFLIIVGAIQDPIRKMIPSSPAYLVLSTAPIWVSMFLGAINFVPQGWNMFKNDYRRLSNMVFIFLVSLIPAIFLSATYSQDSWKLTLVGLLFYLGLFAGSFLGYLFPKNDKYLHKVLILYCLVTAIMMIGTPLDYLGMAKGWKAVGTYVMGVKHVHYGIWGHVLYLVSGFYRSPDVMGWHATVTTMLSVIMALQTKGPKRFLWIAIAGWGLLGTVLCGRRKMIYMLPIFASAMFLLYWRLRSNRFQLKYMLLVCIASVSIGFGFYQMVGPSRVVELYYLENPQSPQIRIRQHAYNALITTYRQSGFFGEGLGTAAQGTQHLKVSKPRTWQEGGLSRMLVELGVIGFICFVFMSYSLAVSAWKMITRRLDVNSDGYWVRVGIFSIICANFGSFIVSHQVFGDPFITVFLAFLVGLLLSGSRTLDTGEKPVGPDI